MITLAVADARLVVDPDAGGRAVSWQVGGRELLFHQGDDPVEYGMYPMAPWAGRLRDNAVDGPVGSHALPVTYAGWALHGTVFRYPLAVVAHQQNQNRQELLLETSHHPEWPWPLSVRVRWLLKPGRLTTDIELVSPESGAPYVLGWHPWFRRHVGASSGHWALDHPRLLRRGGDSLPVELMADTGEGPYDDAFHVASGRASVVWPGELTIDVETEGRWYVVYDERPDAFCLEPQSGPPDGLRAHPWHVADRLMADEPRRWRTTWTMRDLRADPARP